MKIIQEAKQGGVDIFNEENELLLHLDESEVFKIYTIKDTSLHKEDVDGRLFEKTAEIVADYNGLLGDMHDEDFSNIIDEVVDNIPTTLKDKILDEYECNLENSVDWYYCLSNGLDNAGFNNSYIYNAIGQKLFNMDNSDLHIGKWRVHIVREGDEYGVGNSLKHEENRPLVEFYDMSQDKDKFPDGQFTGGRYYLSTLMSSDWGESLADMAKNGHGLDLYSDVPSWTVSPGDLKIISGWLQAVQDDFEFKNKVVEKNVYLGDVDVPFEYGSVENASNNLVARLKAVPEFSDISVENFGTYKGGYGFSFSFVSSGDKESSDALLNYVFNDLKYVASCEKDNNSLEKTLSDAVKRSEETGKETNERGKDREIEKD